jgi:hypothetical protein
MLMLMGYLLDDEQMLMEAHEKILRQTELDES